MWTGETTDDEAHRSSSGHLLQMLSTHAALSLPQVPARHLWWLPRGTETALTAGQAAQIELIVRVLVLLNATSL